MGAVLLTEAVAAALKPGDHATTFGGGPLVATVALDVLRTIAEPGFLATVREKGAALGAALSRLAAASPKVVAVRGRGLMSGIELVVPAPLYVTAALELRLLFFPAVPQGLRVAAPPLVPRRL